MFATSSFCDPQKVLTVPFGACKDYYYSTHKRTWPTKSRVLTFSPLKHDTREKNLVNSLCEHNAIRDGSTCYAGCMLLRL